MLNAMMMVGGAKKKVYQATADVIRTQFGYGSGGDRIKPNSLPNGCKILDLQLEESSRFIVLRIPLEYICRRFYIGDFEILTQEDSMSEDTIRSYWCYDNPYFGQVGQAMQFMKRNSGKTIPIAFEFK